ncbi:MAG: ABC transporter substrate-binding protein [Actinobacteria bacterium]|nr:ABC transporter substrate-binding protein [Actinomycetota bacterium]
MQHRLRRSGRIAALTLAATLLAAGCGGGDSSNDGDNEPETTNAPTGDKDAGTPVPGGSLVYGIEADASGGYCLAVAQLAAGGIQVAQAIYDPLLALDENFKPQPFLAESYTWNDDYTALTFKLREGVTFHDGSPLTAEVVKLNIDAWRAEPETEKRTGLKSLLFRFVLQNIKDVTVDAPLTVTIHTSTPWMTLTDFLASGRSGIMAEAQIVNGEDQCKENLIGTGPFKVLDWKPNVEMNLEKNPNYWRKSADGAQLPYLDKLTFKPVEGGPNRFDALDAGTIQAGHFSGQFQFDAIEETDSLYLTQEADGHMEVGYGLVQTAKAPTDDVAVREHLAMAIDREELNDINSGGKFRVADQPFDTGVIGYLEDIEGIEYDPDTAEEFFAGKNLELKLIYATDPTVKLIADAVKAQLEDVGVGVTIEEMDQATLINQALGGDFNILLWRNHPGLDPDAQYNWWKSGSPVNFGKINDPDIDRLLDEGRVSTDPAAREKIYQDLNRAFVAGRYNQWNWYTAWAVGASRNVHNLTSGTLPDGSKGPGLTWGWHSLAEAWVEQ